MGCCCSTEQESQSQDGEVNERTSLLRDPISNTYQVNASQKSVVPYNIILSQGPNMAGTVSFDLPPHCSWTWLPMMEPDILDFSPSYKRRKILSTSSSDYGNHYSTSATKKSDEQSALNRILQQTASNIIDVGALECHTLEQHEYIERVRTYHQRLNTVPPHKIPNRGHHDAQLLCDVPAAERILSAQPVSLADLNLMMSSTQKIVAALGHIKVEHKEDLVVPFGIP